MKRPTLLATVGLAFALTLSATAAPNEFAPAEITTAAGSLPNNTPADD